MGNMNLERVRVSYPSFSPPLWYLGYLGMVGLKKGEWYAAYKSRRRALQCRSYGRALRRKENLVDVCASALLTGGSIASDASSGIPTTGIREQPTLYERRPGRLPNSPFSIGRVNNLTLTLPPLSQITACKR